MKLFQARRLKLKIILQEWFHKEIAELIHAREKLFSRFKKSKSDIDEENYKKVVKNLIRK